jgi:kynurenine formamidase
MNAQLSLWPLCHQLQQGRFIDLTHTFDSDSPHFEMATPMRIDEVATYQKNGYWVQRFQFEGQWGTHYILLVDDVIAWEDEHGSIPRGAFVALRTDWSKRWFSQEAMYNYDQNGIPHTPGWSLDALSYLYESCQITASGQETMDPDPGFRAKETSWICERYILAHDHYQIDLLSNLDQCPSAGAIVFCVVPKPRHASGFPARVFAICPQH